MTKFEPIKKKKSIIIKKIVHKPVFTATFEMKIKSVSILGEKTNTVSK